MRSLLAPVAILLGSSLASACIYPRAAAPQAAVKWSYSGVDGPLLWHELSPEFAACGKGKHQSPIDIDSKAYAAHDGAADLGGYPRSAAFNITNNGHTVEAAPVAAITAMLGGEPHKLIQFHFHVSSEHHVDGLGYPLEAHFVHTHVKTGAVAVVGVFVDVGPGPGARFFRDIPVGSLLNAGDDVLVESVVLEEIAASVRHVYTYSGSLTTPPCTEKVSWFVSDSPVTISAAQFARFSHAMGFNARYTQGALGEKNLLQQQCGA